VGEWAGTRRGAVARQRIVVKAAELIGERGVKRTSLDDVRAAASVSKSQLYHYFTDKSELIRAVIAHQTEQAMAAQQPFLGRLDTWQGIERWFQALVALQVDRGCRGGCPIGSLASELSEQDEPARRDLVRSFDIWEAHLRTGLKKMRAAGRLSARADPRDLATATMASIQGGLLLTQTRRGPRALRIALGAALRHLRSFARSDG
jgi:TetR/AcrR family transcriptional regulator, transcriptional repressor for nem operon